MPTAEERAERRKKNQEERAAAKKKRQEGREDREGFGEADVQALSSIAGGIGGIFGGIMALQDYNQNIGDAQSYLTQTQDELNRLKESQPSLDTPSAYYEAVKGAYDQRLMQQRTEDINRALATTSQAAAQYGARGLGATLAATAQAQRQQRQVALDQQQLQTAALQNLGAAQQAATQMREARSQADISRAREDEMLAQQNIGALEQQKIQAIAGIAGGVAGAAGGGVGMFLEKGGEIEKTPGEFSHKTNPIHVIDDDGEKIAEMTGGEYIIAPKDANKMKEMSEGKPTPQRANRLFKFVRSLVRRFEK